MCMSRGLWSSPRAIGNRLPLLEYPTNQLYIKRSGYAPDIMFTQGLRLCWCFQQCLEETNRGGEESHARSSVQCLNIQYKPMHTNSLREQISRRAGQSDGDSGDAEN